MQDLEQVNSKIIARKCEGIASLGFPPAISKKFVVSDQVFSITIPRFGIYSAIAPDLYPDQEDEFNIFKDDVLNISVISKVLFATRKYPMLLENQMFMPLALEFTDSEVTIVGKILEYI